MSDIRNDHMGVKGRIILLLCLFCTVGLFLSVPAYADEPKSEPIKVGYYENETWRISRANSTLVRYASFMMPEPSGFV